MNTKKLMKKAAGASTGIAVAAAFFNVALLLVELVKTVSVNETILAELEETGSENAEELKLEESY